MSDCCSAFLFLSWAHAKKLRRKLQGASSWPHGRGKLKQPPENNRCLKAKVRAESRAARSPHNASRGPRKREQPPLSADMDRRRFEISLLSQLGWKDCSGEAKRGEAGSRARPCSANKGLVRPSRGGIYGLVRPNGFGVFYLLSCSCVNVAD